MLNKYNLLRFLIVVLFLSLIAAATETTWRHSGFEISGFDINGSSVYNLTEIRKIEFGWNSFVPAVSDANRAVMYYDDNAKQIKYSVNGGAYQEITSNASVNPYNINGSNITNPIPNASIPASAANLSAPDNKFSGNISIKRGGLASRAALDIDTGGTSYVVNPGTAAILVSNISVNEATQAGGTIYMVNYNNSNNAVYAMFYSPSTIPNNQFAIFPQNGGTAVQSRYGNNGTISPMYLNPSGGGIRVGTLTSATGTPSDICINGNEITINPALTCTVSLKEQKTNFTNVSETDINKLMLLNITKFEFKNQDGSHFGETAQHVAEIYPELARFNKNGSLATYEILEFIPLLIKQNQEQQKQIGSLESRVQKLEDRGILDILFIKQIDYLYKYLNLSKS